MFSPVHDQYIHGRRRKDMESQYPVLAMRHPPFLSPQHVRFYIQKSSVNDRNNLPFRWRPRFDDYSYGNYPRTTEYRPQYNRSSTKGLKRSLENGCHSRSTSPESCDGKRGKSIPNFEMEPSDSLTVEIRDLYMANTQKHSTYDEKKQLYSLLDKYIKESLRETYPECWLFMVGSSENGFGGDTSDLDLCVQVPTVFDVDQFYDPRYVDIRALEIRNRHEAIGALKKVMGRLKRTDRFKALELIQAKVPILKLTHVETGIEVDLNCNNTVGIRNTHLLQYYADLDWRVKPLVLAVKVWARKKKINDAKNMTISSYSLVLMVIHFLQCGVSPPILPCLQQCYPMVFESKQNVHGLRHHAPLKMARSANTSNLGSLFIGFLEYYNKFDFSKNVISIRSGGLLPVEFFQRSYNDPYQWKHLCIEEPFNRSNTARSVYDQRIWERIRQVFEDSYNTLVRTRSLEILLEAQHSPASISETNSLAGSDSGISSEDASS